VVLLGPSVGIKEGSTAKEHNLYQLPWRANEWDVWLTLLVCIGKKDQLVEIYTKCLEESSGLSSNKQ
jgi:hypothetical protein